MSSKKPLLIGLVVCVAATIITLYSFTTWQRARRQSRYSREAPATIVSVDFTNYRTGSVGRDRTDTVVDEREGKRRRTTRIIYRYSVAGETIEAQTFERGDTREKYGVGTQVKACYDPNHPQESLLVAANEPCG